MSNFITILHEVKVASSDHGVRTNNQYQNIDGGEFLVKFSSLPEGDKDGSHYLRTSLTTETDGQCMPRGDKNTHSLASLLILDCDKHIAKTGEEVNGAPDPMMISQILTSNNIGHIIYGSHSHYAGNKGNRYRILLVTNAPYNKESLPTTIEAIITTINTALDDDLLAYAKENKVYAQAWYYPRRQANSNVTPLYIEYLEGHAVNVVEPIVLPLDGHIDSKAPQNTMGEISPIHAFNAQNSITDLLSRYGYKFCCLTPDDLQKWLSPHSSSGVAGIIVKGNKLYSHHNDELNDGFWHDAFDLMRVKEGLTKHNAIIKAAQETVAADGRSVDEYNKNLTRISKGSKSETPNKKDSETDADTVLDDVEPFHEAIDPNQLLLEIEGLVRRFIICSEETIVAVVLWTTMTWFIDVIHVAPLAVITAPEKRCGKSQLLFLLARLVKRPLPASNITPAALFRSIDIWHPTILIDEADTFMKDNEELRGILNCGHTRESAYIVRTVGKDFQPRKFNVWGAKALAGIGHLPSTIMDRAIMLELRRKLPHECVDRLRHEEDVFLLVKSKLSRFFEDYKQVVPQERPILPASLNDREQDNWESLLAIADVVGNEWPIRARQAAVKLSEIDSSTTSIGSELLLSIQDIFEHKRIDRISSADLISFLCSDDEQQWATYNRGNPITPRQIASRLKEYGIHSKSVRFGASTPKGYELAQFNEAFARYLSPSLPPPNIRNTQQISTHMVYSVAYNETVAATLSSSATPESLPVLGCCGVADKIGGLEEEMEVEI